MDDLVALPFLFALWVAQLIYGLRDGSRSQFKINTFRTIFAIAFVFLYARPALRAMGLHRVASLWSYPDPIFWTLFVFNFISLLIFAIGEGHHDEGWNHKRGWYAIMASCGIVALAAVIIYLGLPK